LSRRRRRHHNAVHLGHVGNAVNRAGTIARSRVRICVRTLCSAFRIYEESIHFISRFHDLTFVNAGTGAIIYGWPAIGHLAIHLSPGF
jgi:hypothetical protein